MLDGEVRLRKPKEFPEITNHILFCLCHGLGQSWSLTQGLRILSDDNGWTPRIHVMYRPVPRVTWRASHSRDYLMLWKRLFLHVCMWNTRKVMLCMINVMSWKSCLKLCSCWFIFKLCMFWTRVKYLTRHDTLTHLKMRFIALLSPWSSPFLPPIFFQICYRYLARRMRMLMILSRC